MHLLAGLNLFLTRRADYTGALAAAERFAELAHASQNSVEIVASEWMLGATHNLIGHQQLALELIARGLARAEALGIGNTYYFGFDNKGRGTIGRIWTSWLCGLPETAMLRAAEVLAASTAQRRSRSRPSLYTVAASKPMALYRRKDWAGDRRCSIEWRCAAATRLASRPHVPVVSA
ncbi:hypothetical protein [Bradyrhizobium sp. AZCC 2230]|uniref:hypothetical protein n=1 Tax=Bradyrhizobium sp. AZCC 2230 TaxID=3117021 RepID=UPI002FF0C9C4